jgi:26S proteasome regulatory subunit T1
MPWLFFSSEQSNHISSQGARMVRELFEMARSKKACLIFFDEIDAIGGARFDDGAGGDNEVQRTMLELINQLDGFDPRGNIKVINRILFKRIDKKKYNSLGFDGN